MERMTSPNYVNPNEPIEKTLALIKPDGMRVGEEIIQKILQAGFKIIQCKILKLTPEQASEFYKNLYGTTEFPFLVSGLCEGPIRVMCLAKPQAVKEFKALMGMPTARQSQHYWPGSLRAYFGSLAIDVDNAIHGSEDVDRAKFEISFFFPNLFIEPIMNKDWQLCYLYSNVYYLLMSGLFETVKQRPSEPIIFLANWLLQHNPNKPLFNEFDDRNYLPTIIEEHEN